MSEPVCHMIVWGFGMIAFITDPDADPEVDGAILVCTAHGRDDIDALLETVREASVLTNFGPGVALRVPNLSPDAPTADVYELIYWSDELREKLAADHSAIAWVRQ